jgi:hypothetical protein
LNDQPLKQEHNLSLDKQLEGKLESLIDQVWHDLQGQVSREVVQQTLLEIIPKYEGARVTKFVPTLIRRDTLNTLRATLSQAEVESGRERKSLPEQTTGEPGPQGLQRLWRRLEALLVQLAVVER